MNYQVTKKPKLINEQNARKIICPKNVYQLKEIQEIKDAIQEHLMYIGLDRGNHIRNIDILGIGGSSSIEIDAKYIVRKAIINANDRVILVHNHPSNTLEQSAQDTKFTSNVEELLKMFNIQLVDHIIVTENSYVSIKNQGKTNKLDYSLKHIKNKENEIEMYGRALMERVLCHI